MPFAFGFWELLLWVVIILNLVVALITQSYLIIFLVFIGSQVVYYALIAISYFIQKRSRTLNEETKEE